MESLHRQQILKKELKLEEDEKIDYLCRLVNEIEMDKDLRIIISGGGTGGHIFPAVSIANAIKAKHPDAKILFVAALEQFAQ